MLQFCSRFGDLWGESKRKYSTTVSLKTINNRIVVVQLLSHVQLFAIPRTAACQASLSFTVSQSLFKFMSIEAVMPSNHVILCCLLVLPSTFPKITVSSNESDFCIRCSKYWIFSSSISPSSEYSGLISFKIDWFDLLAVQGTLKSSPMPHFKAQLWKLLLRGSAFFMVQLSHPYMTPGKTIALTMQNFVGKVMSLFF